MAGERLVSVAEWQSVGQQRAACLPACQFVSCLGYLAASADADAPGDFHWAVSPVNSLRCFGTIYAFASFSD